MEKVNPFNKFANRYDHWFRENEYVYLSELRAIKEFTPKGIGLEVGVGTGRFAEPLEVEIGVDPSLNMGKIAKKRGIYILQGMGEYLPFIDESFDFLINITTLCFLNDIEKSFREAHRILKKNGTLILGFIDKNSSLGKIYQKKREKNPFYRVAKFYSVDQILKLLKKTGFIDFNISQTIFKKLDKIDQIEPSRLGYGEGSFISLQASKGKV